MDFLTQEAWVPDSANASFKNDRKSLLSPEFRQYHQNVKKSFCLVSCVIFENIFTNSNFISSLQLHCWGALNDVILTYKNMFQPKTHFCLANWQKLQNNERKQKAQLHSCLVLLEPSQFIAGSVFTGLSISAIIKTDKWCDLCPGSMFNKFWVN